MKIYVVTNCTAEGNYTPSIFISEEKAKGWVVELAVNLIRSYSKRDLSNISDKDIIKWAFEDKDTPGWTLISICENEFFIGYGNELFNKVCLHELELELSEEQLKEVERNAINKYLECEQDFDSDFWKNPEHFNLYQEAMKEQLDKCDADRYVHLYNVLGVNIGLDKFRIIDSDMWNGAGGSLDILDIDRVKKNEEWHALKEILKDENIEVLKLSMDEAYAEIENFRDKLGEMFLDIFNEEDNCTLEMAKGIIAAFEKCETQRDYDIANTMLRGICGFGLDHIIEEIRKRDTEGFVWESV